MGSTPNKTTVKKFNREGGGAISLDDTAGTTIDNCIFENNETVDSGGAILGAPVSLTNCLFTGNIGQRGGGALCYTGTDFLAINACTFGHNSSAASTGGAVFCPESCSLDIDNSLIYGNFPEQILTSSGTVTASFSNIQDRPYDGSGVIDADPLYTNVPLETTFANSPGTTTTLVLGHKTTTISPDYIIEIGDDGIARTVTAVVSGDEITFVPALDEPAPEGIRVDIWGENAIDLDLDIDFQAGSPCIDAANGDTAPELDLLGLARYDDPDVANTGSGECDYVDIGCFEYQGQHPMVARSNKD